MHAGVRGPSPRPSGPLARGPAPSTGRRDAYDPTPLRRNAVDRHAISTEPAPPAIGPYSQAIVAGGFVFCSGTAGIDPVTGTVPEGIEAQTRLALNNLDAILTAAGASLATLVKTTIFYRDVDD